MSIDRHTVAFCRMKEKEKENEKEEKENGAHSGTGQREPCSL